MRELVEVLATLFLIQLSPNVCGKARDDGLSPWAPTINARDDDGTPGSAGFGLAAFQML